MLWRCHADPLILPNPFFHFKQFSILYQDKGLRVTTDSCLLGAITVKHSLKDAGTILDIGTGTGVVALMLAQHFRDAEIHAVEIQEEIARQAHLNFEASPFASQLHLLQTDFLELAPYPCDLIVCNPPYYTQHLSGRQEQKNLAVHNSTLEHQALIEHAQRFMHEHSLFSLVLPFDLMPSRLQMAEASGLYPVYQCEVFNTPGKPYRTITLFGKTRTEFRQDSLTLQDNKGEKSPEFIALMQDYYLDDSSQYKDLKKLKPNS